MSTTNDKHIKILNGLVESTLISAHGYSRAVEGTTNARFRSLFATRSMQRKQLSADLQAEVRGLGGRPKDDSAILAVPQRTFLNLSSAMGGSEQSVINVIEAGEDYLKAAFEHVLQEEHLSAPVKTVVARVYTAIKADQNQIRDLTHTLQAQAPS